MGEGIIIRAGGKDYGPYTERELKAEIEAGRVPFSSWIHREGVWKLLAEIAELREAHPDFEPRPGAAPAKVEDKSALAAVAPAGATARGEISPDAVWFVIRAKKKYGPYSAAEIIGQLQRKQLDSGAFVWRPGYATWKRVTQVSEFSRDTMKKMLKEGDAVDILVKRKHPRAPYEVEIIAHDNARVLEGKSMVIGEGGLYLQLAGPLARPVHDVGARLKLHFSGGDAPPFNAVAEIVSVVRGENPGYSMRFVAISDADRRRIAKLVGEKKKS